MANFSGTLADVDIRLLRIFVAISDSGGLTRAAEKLGVDRSTVSRQLKDLETRLGIELYKRERRGMTISEEGKVVLHLTIALLKSFSDFQHQMGLLQDDMTGRIMVSVAECSITHPQFGLAKAVADMTAGAPLVDLSLRFEAPDEVEKAVLSRTADLGLTTGVNKRAGLRYRYLSTDRNRLYAAVSHPVFKTAPVRLEHIASMPVASVRYASGMSAQIERLRLKRGALTNSSEGMAALILSGCYLGYLPSHYARQWEERGRIRPLDIPNTDYNVDLCVVHIAETTHAAIIDLFMSYVAFHC